MTNNIVKYGINITREQIVGLTSRQLGQRRGEVLCARLEQFDLQLDASSLEDGGVDIDSDLAKCVILEQHRGFFSALLFQIINHQLTKPCVASIPVPGTHQVVAIRRAELCMRRSGATHHENLAIILSQVGLNAVEYICQEWTEDVFDFVLLHQLFRLDQGFLRVGSGILGKQLKFVRFGPNFEATSLVDFFDRHLGTLVAHPPIGG